MRILIGGNDRTTMMMLKRSPAGRRIGGQTVDVIL